MNGRIVVLAEECVDKGLIGRRWISRIEIDRWKTENICELWIIKNNLEIGNVFTSALIYLIYGSVTSIMIVSKSFFSLFEFELWYVFE